MAVASAGTAALLPFQATWSISFATDTSEVTAFGDQTKVYVAGLPDASGDFSGFYDDATAQTYTAASDGIARAFYLYPSALLATQYFWGTVILDYNVDSDVGSAVSVKAAWKAATPIVKVG